MMVSCLALGMSLPAAATTPAKSQSQTRKAPTSASKTTHAKATASTHSKATVKKTSSKSKKTKESWRTRGQQVIDTNRAREIQAALIREHYLDGNPTGMWDARSKAAMVKFQGDNGWQTKKIPDSRALIKLGLGPDRANLINPETASIAQPEPGKGGAPQR